MRRHIALAAITALVLAACGGSGPDPADEPKQALISAFESMGNYDGIEMILSVDSDEASLTAASEGEIARRDARTILGSTFTVRSKNTDSPEDTEVEMVADIAGDLVEIKAVGTTFYVRADVEALVERFGGDPRELDQQIDAAQQAGEQYAFLEPAIRGEWIEVQGGEELQKQLGAGQSPDEELQKQISEDLKNAVEEHAEVTSEGDDDIGHHLVATASVRPMFEALVNAIQKVPGANLPGGQLPDAQEVPDQEIRVDFWVEDDQIRRILFDIAQFRDWEDATLPKGVDRLAILVDLGEFTDTVEAPDAAASVDAQQLLQGVLGPATGMGSPGQTQPAPSDIAEFCEQLKDQPAEVRDQFAQECGDI